jgi:hydrogenase maturation factor HypF (carbamoyltransferase family)
MTRQKQALSFLVFQSMAEVMLDLYGNSKNLKQFDTYLLNKLKNLKPDLERISKKVHTFYNEEEIETFYYLTNVLEYITNVDNEKDFTELIGLLSAWKSKEVTIINSREELIEIVNEKN